MRVALIEFEYPPDTATGGIGFYTYQVARALTKRGHTVEVFAGALDRLGTTDDDGVLVHRICKDAAEFSAMAGDAFLNRHLTSRFDVLEGSELTAPARHAVRLVPDIPLVVRLHGPSFKLRTMSMPAMPLMVRLRNLAGALRRGHLPFWYTTQSDRIERDHARSADIIAATSNAVGQLAARRWRLDRRRVVASPLPFTPNPALLEITPGGDSRTVTFVGHVSVSKGMVDLIEAMAVVMSRDQHVRLRVVGGIGPSPEPGKDMRQHIHERMRNWLDRIDIVGPVPNEKMAQIYRHTDIMVLPSHWDTFPLVCLEAMAAARAIIGTRVGGIPEILNERSSAPAGVVTSPFSPGALARAILSLVDDSKNRIELGIRARQRLLTTYSLELALQTQEMCYERAIAERNGSVRHGPIAAFG
jgi:glycogen(starch) synthase